MMIEFLKPFILICEITVAELCWMIEWYNQIS